MAASGAAPRRTPQRRGASPRTRNSGSLGTGSVALTQRKMQSVRDTSARNWHGSRCAGLRRGDEQVQRPAVAGSVGRRVGPPCPGRDPADLAVVTVPLRVIGSVPVEPLNGKVVIDTNNYYPQRDGVDNARI